MLKNALNVAVVFLCILLGAQLSSSAAAPLRVALLLPGSDTDHGWNQMAREGLDRIKSQLHAQTRCVTNVKAADFYNRMSDFAEDGFDVIICHGGEFAKAAQKAAAQYPRTHFIIGGCPDEVPGAVSVEFMTRDASELVGMAAANLTQAHKIAFIGADPVPPLQACYDGMSDGAKASGAALTLLPALWTNSWDSPTIAREKTEAAIASGADVIYQNVDAAAVGVFQACQDSTKSGKTVWAFGCNSNQNGIAPDVVVGSVVLDIQKAYTDLTRDVSSGKLKPGSVKLGLTGGFVDLVLNDKHPAVTDAIKQKVQALRQTLLEKAGTGK